MECPSCAHDNPADSSFCLECGIRLSYRCRRCNAELPPAAKFCNKCGEAGGKSSSGSKRDPRSYTPKHLVEKILHAKSALEGERKQVTVLFADVKGSMELAEAVDPEAWHRILNRFFEILTDGVHRFEGTVNQYTGDGIMALFGAPIAHEDHAQRACYAALHLKNELRRYSDELRLSRGLSFSVRMGLNSGEVVVGKIGDDLRMDYTAQGQTVGLAARMEQIAAPGRIYLAEPTARLAEGFFGLRDLGKSRMSGVRDAVRVYELRGIGQLRTRFEVASARGFSKFVGRGDEMATLESALERAIQGNGQVVGVVGEAGVGKSRLCFEFTAHCRARGLAVYEAHAVAHGKGVPFLPIRELFRSYFGITDKDSDEVARDKIAGRSVRLDESLAEALPLLFDFLAVPDPRSTVAETNPEARRHELFGVMKRLTRARSQREPAVFSLEDLHWMDGGSEGFLENLVESLPGTRTLVLVNFRPEYRAPWSQKSYYEQLPLVPLGSESIAELLQDLLGSDPSVAGLSDLIQERTAGNPFFIEEVVLTLAQSGALEGTSGAYRLVQPIDELTVPGTVQAVLAARIDRLPEREKHLLQMASVIGKKFAGSVLEEVAELPERELGDVIRALIASEFIYEEALYPEAEYAFRHPLTQEVAYDSQLSEGRARVHIGVARALEALDPGKLDERAALLAYHCERGGDLRVAARWHKRAAVWIGFSDLVESRRHWRKVWKLLDRLPESRETIAEGAEACAALIRLAVRMGGSEDDVASLFRQGKVLARRGGDLRALTRIQLHYGFFRFYAGELREGRGLLEEAIQSADQTGDLGLRVITRVHQMGLCGNAGDLTESLRRADEVIQLSQRDPDLGADLLGYSPYLFLLGLRGAYLAWAGRCHQAELDLERALATARQRDDPLNCMVAQLMYVELHEATGVAPGALAHARESLELTEKMANHAGRVIANRETGVAYILNEDWDDALSALNRALAIAHEHETGLHYEAAILVNLARVHGEFGHASEALALAKQAVEVAQRSGTKFREVQAEIEWARALSQEGRESLRTEIDGHLDAASRLVEETGGESQRPMIREVRAKAARAFGNHAQYERELREAHRLYVEMGATGHAERLAEELGL